MQPQRKSTHQPYGKIAEVLDTEMSFSDYFSKRQLDKVKISLASELEDQAREDSAATS